MGWGEVQSNEIIKHEQEGGKGGREARGDERQSI